MFGVRPPIMPRWYALTFYSPISSVMMTRMLGFFACALAGPAAPRSAVAAVRTAKVHLIRLLGFIVFPWGLVPAVSAHNPPNDHKSDAVHVRGGVSRE